MPDKVFLYVGSPVSSIIGYASVKKMERISKSDALAMADDGCISRDELDIYLDNKQDVTAIFIEDYRLFEKPISADEISRFMVFHPPQNFVGLTDDESILIKEMGN